MKQILAFGDSNTWGLIPGTWDRYPEYVRWTGILRKAVLPLGFRILEDGVCGRTTVFDDPGRPLRRGIDSIPRYKDIEGISLVILMLPRRNRLAAGWSSASGSLKASFRLKKSW